METNTEKPASLPGQVQPIVMRCDNCFTPGRPAKLVSQEVVGPLDFGKVSPFVFRYRLCQWCLAAENRRAAKEGRSKQTTLAYKPDAEVWAEHNAPGEGRGILRTLDPIVGNLDSEVTHG